MEGASHSIGYAEGGFDVRGDQGMWDLEENMRRHIGGTFAYAQRRIRAALEKSTRVASAQTVTARVG